MPGDRFTPDEITQLVESGELNASDLPLLHPADAKIAMPLLTRRDIDASGGVMGEPLMPPGMVKAISAAPNIGKAIMTALGMGSTPSKPTTGPAPGQRRAPVMGSRVYGPKDNPSQRPPAKPYNPPNLERHGNLTRPGPDASRGGGGPSSPNRSTNPPRNPAEETTGFKGPVGDDSFYKDVPRVSRPIKSVGAELNRGDRRSGLRESEMYREMKAGLPDTPGGKRIRNVIDAKRQPPTAAFDETDKRKVMFGGIGAKGPINERKPLSKKQVEELIQQLLKMK